MKKDGIPTNALESMVVLGLTPFADAARKSDVNQSHGASDACSSCPVDSRYNNNIAKGCVLGCSCPAVCAARYAAAELDGCIMKKDGIPTNESSSSSSDSSSSNLCRLTAKPATGVWYMILWSRQLCKTNHDHNYAECFGVQRIQSRFDCVAVPRHCVH